MTTQLNDNQIPVIQTGHALMSLRDSGHNLPTALGEPVDNSIEAGANNINIWLYEGQSGKGKKHVHQIAIADDGCGMNREDLHHYLVLGHSTRYMSTDTIGKYGVGAKLAAFNFCTHIQVWSRTNSDDPWLKAEFDLLNALEVEKAGGTVGVSEPTEAEIPATHLKAFPFKTGTLVVWSNVDRLEEGRMARNFNELRLEVEKELSRMFRYFIDGGRLFSLNGKELLAHDPLMLLENTWSDTILSQHLARVDGKKQSKDIRHFAATLIGDDTITIDGETARVRVTLYPKEVTRKSGMGGDKLAKQLRVPENEGCISFVRMDREVSYAIVPRIFGRRIGNPDRFIGIEVAFTPTLDDYFGIRNVKRGVEPHGDLRDNIRVLVQRHAATALQRLAEAWGDAAREDRDHNGEHGAVTEAVKRADKTMPTGQSGADKSDEEVEEALTSLAKDVGLSKAEEVESYKAKVKDMPFVVESVDFPGKLFMQTEHLPGKVIIRLNTRHKFYKDIWEPLESIASSDPGAVSGAEAVRAARRSVEALTLLIIAYGKAESMDENPVEKYDDLLSYWGQFLSSLMTKIKGVR